MMMRTILDKQFNCNSASLVLGTAILTSGVLTDIMFGKAMDTLRAVLANLAKVHPLLPDNVCVTHKAGKATSAGQSISAGTASSHLRPDTSSAQQPAESSTPTGVSASQAANMDHCSAELAGLSGKPTSLSPDHATIPAAVPATVANVQVEVIAKAISAAEEPVDKADGSKQAGNSSAEEQQSLPPPENTQR